MDFDFLVRIALPVVNFAIMCGLGLTLEVDDFRRVARRPRPVAVGLAGHYVLLPMLGFAMAWLFRDTPAFAIGFVLLAACPSASASNVLSYLAGGNVALAVTLTAISALATLASIPLFVHLAEQLFDAQGSHVRLSVPQTLAHLAVLIVLPVVLGMTVRHRARAWALRAEPWVSRGGLAGLLLVIVVFVASQHALVLDSIARLGPATLMMGALALGSGVALARVAGLSIEDTLTIGMEVGVQNCMLAMLVAVTLMNEPRMALPAATYGLTMFVCAFTLVALGRRWRAARAST